MSKAKICREKNFYKSKKQANLAVRRLKNKSYILESYRCNICEHYHLTKKKTVGYKKRARSNA